MARKPGEPRHKPYTRAETGPFCNAKTKQRGLPCRQPAGYKTDHPGQGRCFVHGGRANRVVTKHGRYSQIKHHRVSEIMDRMAQVEQNVMDLIPEAQLLRAVVIDFIENYDQFAEALMAWYADPENHLRPRKLMDVTDCVGIVESISRIIYRLHQIQSQGAISLDTFRRVTEQMGLIVAKYVRDENALRAISLEWSGLALDAKTEPIENIEEENEE